MGIILGGVALYLVGAISTPNFYDALNTFRNEAVPFGGFWYRGADIAVFGLALTLPSLGRKKSHIAVVLMAMMCISFFLRRTRAGLKNRSCGRRWCSIVYSRGLFKSVECSLLALAATIAFLGAGAKTWFLPRDSAGFKRRYDCRKSSSVGARDHRDALGR